MANLDLVLDSVYKGGRIILVQGNEFIYETNLQQKRIRSDNLLAEIKSALETKTTQLDEIKRLTLIESSDGITKNRVFKSIALGIKDSLNIELRIINPLDIFRLPFETECDYIFAYESDNEKVNWFEYTRKTKFEGNQFLGHIAEFYEVIHNTDKSEIYVAGKLHQKLEKNISKPKIFQFNLDSKIKARLIT